MLGQVRKRAYRLRCGLGQRICAAAAAAEHRSPARPWPRILMQEAPGKKTPQKKQLNKREKKIDIYHQKRACHCGAALALLPQLRELKR